MLCARVGHEECTLCPGLLEGVHFEHLAPCPEDEAAFPDDDGVSKSLLAATLDWILPYVTALGF